jgi:hypothetical protein
MSTKDQLRALIKKIIKEEVREAVEQQVNAELAERFISNIQSNQTLTEVVLDGDKVGKVVSKSNFKEKEKELLNKKAALREHLLKKVGADTNPMMAMIYGDEDLYENKAPVITRNGMVAPMSQPQQLANGMVVDSDDEGIDISQFLGKK